MSPYDGFTGSSDREGLSGNIPQRAVHATIKAWQIICSNIHILVFLPASFITDNLNKSKLQ